MAHILLVDDFKFSREFLLHELVEMGHEVSCIEDGDALFVFLEDHTPDLVLLDPNLNGFKGWDLLRDIKRPGRPRMPTILFTCFETTLLDDRSFLADGYVIKSVNTQKLREKISEMLTFDKESGLNQQSWLDPTHQHPSDASGHSLFAGQGDKTHGRP